MYIVVCRLCLNTHNLMSIFQIKEKHERYTLVLGLTTGLKIQLNDGLPQMICKKCTTSVNAALKLRNQSHSSELNLIAKGFQRNNTIDIEEQPQIKKTDDCIDEIPEDCSDFDGFNVEVEVDRVTDDDDSRELIIDENYEDPTLTEEKSPVQTILAFSNGVISTQEQETDLNPNKILLLISQAKVQKEDPKKEEPKKKEPKRQVKKDRISVKERTAMYMSLVDGVLDKEGAIRCRACKKTVSNWRSFINHAKIHLGFKFVCEFCGKRFISSTQLKRHCRSYHGMKRDIKCQYCSYLALDNTQLLNHVRRWHTGERPYTCNTCNSSYSSRKCLIQHIEGHNTTYTVQCDLCDAMFKSRRHYAKHKYSAHAKRKYREEMSK